MKVATPLTAATPRAQPAPGIAFGIAALLIPPVAVLVPLGLALLLALLAATLVAAEPHRAFAAARPYAALAGLLALLAGWAALSALWSPIPGHSFLEGLRFLALSAAGLVVFAVALTLSAVERRRAGYLLLAGIAIAIAVLQFELLTDGIIARHFHREGATLYAWIARYDRGATMLLLVLWPAAALLWAERRRAALAVLVLATAATILEYHSRATTVALASSPVLAAISWRAPRSLALGLTALLLAIGLALPLVAPAGAGIAYVQRSVPFVPDSGIHRLGIWRFSADRIAERPLLGWGMDAARAIPGGHTPVALLYPPVKLTPYAEALPLHPHDAPLQWRLELGLPGLLLASAAIGLALWRVATASGWPPWRRAAAFGYAGSALVIALVSFGIWQSWWLSALWLGAAHMASLGEPTECAAG
ncbi:MAG TPA: O-antigen ligase family protein [Stellaceae bacterium]|nr:O-antigen ligase family protein [Stellaceae bacterium]